MASAVIDLEVDTVVPVNELCKKRLGKRISPATLWRWIHRGVGGGIRLEAVQAAGVWCSTPAAFAEFLRAQTAACMSSETDDSAAERSEATTEAPPKAGVL